MRHRLLRVSILAIAAGLLWMALGCSDRDGAASLTEAFLTYDEAELINFNLYGDAVCSTCGDEDDYVGVQIDLYLKGDPTHDLDEELFDSLGPFEFRNLRTHPNTTVVVRGRLYYSDSVETPPVNAYGEFETPGSDGETIAITLTFPSSK